MAYTVAKYVLISSPGKAGYGNIGRNLSCHNLCSSVYPPHLSRTLWFLLLVLYFPEFQSRVFSEAAAAIV